MIISAYQPYFAPYCGFFAKAILSETLVIMDSVQFPRGTTWLTRNRFKNDQGLLWLTIPVWKKGYGLQKIKEVQICREGRWPKKIFASLKAAYMNAPFFKDHLGFLEEIFSEQFKKLIQMNVAIIQYAMEQLKISTKLVLQSELGIDAKEPYLSVEVCKALGASHFLAQSGAKKYLDEKLFCEANIQLMFFNPRAPVYPQLWGPFIPNLSVFDLIFNCGPAAGDILKKVNRPIREKIDSNDA